MLKSTNSHITFPIFDKDIESLKENGFLNDNDELTQFGRNFISNDYEALFEELLETYPKKEGLRRLHNSKDKCKRKYISYLNKGLDHTEVIKGIQKEKEVRHHAALTGQWLPGWKMLSTYINNKGWEEYLEEPHNEENDYNDEEKI
jgi:hypothetical protein